jgi:hypothetical protein
LILQEVKLTPFIQLVFWLGRKSKKLAVSRGNNSILTRRLGYSKNIFTFYFFIFTPVKLSKTLERRTRNKYLIKRLEIIGFEPMAPCLQSICSTAELYPLQFSSFISYEIRTRIGAMKRQCLTLRRKRQLKRRFSCFSLVRLLGRIFLEALKTQNFIN